MTNFIYGYVDPRTNFLRYVGKSSTGIYLPNRFKEHYGHCRSWIKNLAKIGLVPEIIVLEELPDNVSQEEINEAEIHAIAYWRFLGCDLTNLTAGGDGFRGKHSDETKKKMSKILLGHKRNLGRKASLETKIKLSKASKGHKRLVGYKHTEKTKAKHRTYRPSPEALINQSKGLIGNKNSLGRKNSNKQNENHSAFMMSNKYSLGYKHSKAQNEKHSAFMKSKWAAKKAATQGG